MSVYLEGGVGEKASDQVYVGVDGVGRSRERWLGHRLDW